MSTELLQIVLQPEVAAPAALGGALVLGPVVRRGQVPVWRAQTKLPVTVKVLGFNGICG